MSRLQLTSVRPLPASTNGGECFAAVLQPQGLPVTIKCTRFRRYVDANAAIREAVVLAGLRHSSIVTVYDCYIEQEGEGMRLNLVTEAVERSLKMEIEEREMEGRAWTEVELWQLFKAVLGALTCAQAKSISHRNITPSSIFLTSTGPKLTHFSQSIGNLNLVSLRTSILGDVFYYSPELKEAFLADQSGASGQQFAYDPIKSDVFALGVTMLYAASLRKPAALSNIFHLEKTISELISGIGQYPAMQWFVGWMLTIEPANRPTFVQISDYIAQWEAGIPGNSAV